MKEIEKIPWAKFKLTVVMPLYNREAYLRQAVASVLSQKTDFSLLLVIADDASDDTSAEIAKVLEREYPDKILTLFSKKNRGLLANDLRVLAHMRSQYFCVLDPDDYWVDEHFLQKAVSFLDSHDEYTAYGSNTRFLVEDKIQEGYYIKTEAEEISFDGIEDYLCGRACVTHTTASVYRNVMFLDGVPDIMKNAVGTLAEASFRGDADRYVMHLKYGKAKFVNEWVGVYRLHEKGICQGGSTLHWMLMNARAELDYSDFYENQYRDQFMSRARRTFKKVCSEVYKASVFDDFFEMDEYDKQNFAYLMNVLSDKHPCVANMVYFTDFPEEEKKVRKLIRNREKRKIILWGTGGSAEPLMKKYEIFIEDVEAFVDGNREKSGTCFMGKNVIEPENLEEINDKYVVIVNGYYHEILKDIEERKLCRREDVINLFWYDRFIAGLQS